MTLKEYNDDEFKYLTNDDLIGKLIAKLPKDKQKKPQNILNSRRVKKPCVVDGIDWCGLFDIVDGEAVIEKNFPAYHNLKKDLFPSHLTIPSSLAGCPVTRIAEDTFRDFKLTCVVIPVGVTAICQFAFNGNERLKAITIPEGVKRIGLAAFGGCTALREVVVPKSVETIQENAFWGCLLLEKFVLKSDDTTIKGNAFHKCRNLRWVETPTKKVHPETWADLDALVDREKDRIRRDNPVIY